MRPLSRTGARRCACSSGLLVECIGFLPVSPFSRPLLVVPWSSFLSRCSTTKFKSTTKQEALDATFAPIAIGQILASVENLCVAKLYESDQLLRGTSARDAKPQTLKRSAHSILDTRFPARALSLSTLGAAVSLLLSRGRRRPQIVAATALAISTALSEHRTPYGETVPIR